MTRDLEKEWQIWKERGVEITLEEYLKDPSWFPPEEYEKKEEGESNVFSRNSN